MSKDWFFGPANSDGTIEAICHAVTEDGMTMGDCFATLHPGQTLDGASHGELLAAGVGILQVGDDGYSIVKLRRRRRRR